MTPFDTVNAAIERGDYENKVPFWNEYGNRNPDYYAGEKAANDKFEKDLARAYDVFYSSKRFKLFKLAWERGHSSGYDAILQEYDTLSELVI